jgi:hypothetical protein
MMALIGFVVWLVVALAAAWLFGHFARVGRSEDD